MTPELIGILAVGATLTGVGATMIGLLLTFRRDARSDSQALRAEFRADNQRQRAEARADMASFRTEMRADMQDLRTEVRGDLASLRKDVQALTERLSRLEGAIQGFFAGPGARDRHDDAA